MNSADNRKEDDSLKGEKPKREDSEDRVYSPSRAARAQSSESVNREHVAKKLFTSRGWLIYCLCQVMLTLIILVAVSMDLKNK